MYAASDCDESRFVQTIGARQHGTLYIPTSGDPPHSYETARFIGKVGLEVLAQRGTDIEGWNEEIVNKRELDELRDYVRRGKPGFVWPLHMRRLYPADRLFPDANGVGYQVLHEWDILFIPSPESLASGEYYAIVAILGMEFAINLGGPELDGFHQWLADNGGRSPLYNGSEAEQDGSS